MRTERDARQATRGGTGNVRRAVITWALWFPFHQSSRMPVAAPGCRLVSSGMASVGRHCAFGRLLSLRPPAGDSLQGPRRSHNRISGNPDSIEDGRPHVLGACTVQSHHMLSPLQAADGHVRYPRPFPTALRRRRTAAAPPPGARDCAPRPSTLLLRPASSSPSCSPMSCRSS